MDYDDVVILGGVPYFVRNNEREGRFGLEDEPKFWVKRSINLLTGETEGPEVGLQGALRGQDREPRVRMRAEPPEGGADPGTGPRQGGFHAGDDGAGLRRPPASHPRLHPRQDALPDRAHCSGQDHEDFFYDHFPIVLDEYVGIVEAIRFLHQSGEKHGDIRRDHLIKDETTGRYRWIDYDFNYRHGESRFAYDLFGLGNILVFITGRGDVTTNRLLAAGARHPGPADRRRCEHRVPQPRRQSEKDLSLHPRIPEPGAACIFPRGPQVYYETTEELLEDLGEAREELERR